MRYRIFCWSLIVLAAQAGLLRPPSAYAAGRSCTPMAPLEVALTPLPRQKRDPKGERRLRVQVTPLVDAVWLEVELSLPPGVTLVQGEARWRAPARARLAQTRELLLKVPAAGERCVVATAQLLFRRSLPMGRATSYTFNEDAARSQPPGGADRSARPQEPPSFPTIPAPH